MAATQLKIRASPWRNQISGVPSGMKKRSLSVSLTFGVARRPAVDDEADALRVVGDRDPVQDAERVGALERRRVRPLGRRLARCEAVAEQVQAPVGVAAGRAVVVDDRRRHLRLRRSPPCACRSTTVLPGRVGQHGAVGHAGAVGAGSRCRRTRCRPATDASVPIAVNGAAVDRALERHDVGRVLGRRPPRGPRRVPRTRCPSFGASSAIAGGGAIASCAPRSSAVWRALSSTTARYWTRRARRDVRHVVEHAVRRVVVRADVLPAAVAHPREERDLGERVAAEVRADLEAVAARSPGRRARSTARDRLRGMSFFAT